jgi:hypothetical protein
MKKNVIVAISFCIALVTILVIGIFHYRAELTGIFWSIRHPSSFQWKDLQINLPHGFSYDITENGEELKVFEFIGASDRQLLFIRKTPVVTTASDILKNLQNKPKTNIDSYRTAKFKDYESVFVDSHSDSVYIRAIHVLPKRVVIGIVSFDRSGLAKFDRVLDEINFREK